MVGKLTPNTMLSASRLPAVMGLSKYRSPNDELLMSIDAIQGKEPEPISNEAMDWGNKMEPTILMEAANRLGLTQLSIDHEEAYFHDDWPISCSLDGTATGSMTEITTDPERGIYVVGQDFIMLEGTGVLEVDVINGVTTVSMPRNLVNEDKDKTCSEGLHFCSYDYLQHFGGARIVVLKINPADIVSIPADYNNSKGRCSKYQVVDELEVENKLPKQAIPDGFVADYTGPVPSLPNTKTQGILDKRACLDIRGELVLGVSIRELARKFNVSRRTIAQVS